LTKSVAEDLKLTNKAVVNIPANPAAEKAPQLAGRPETWQIGGVEIRAGDRGRRETELATAKAAFEKRRETTPSLQGTEFQIEIRADRSIKYSYIQPVMMAAAKVGIARMNITALE
jgi:biopolymer transport protein ExbD